MNIKSLISIQALKKFYTEITKIFASKEELNAGLSGKANSEHGTHVTYSSSSPKANGTASAGSANNVARGDHVHPLQTTVSGNAGSANKVNNNLTVQLNNGSTEGTDKFTFDGSTAKTVNITPGGIGAAESSHTHSSYVNQNAFAKFTVGSTTITADAAQDTLTIVAGSNVTLTPDATNDKLTIAAKDTTYSTGTSTTEGLTRLYGETGSETNGTMTQAAISTELNKKANSSHTHDDRYYTESEINTKVSTLNTAISTAESNAKSYADTKIAALVDSAPDAMNTLNELASAISDHQDVYDAYVTEMTTKLAGKSDTGHTHNYAGSSSAGGAATSANKVNKNIVVKLNGGNTEDTNLFTFNGSTAKTINITPSNIGAAASSHNHDDKYYTESEIDAKVTTINTSISGKADKSHGNHVPATETANNAKFLRNDNTWQTVTPANIGAATSSHTHDDRYYTETEINTKISDINSTINTTKTTLQANIDAKANTAHGSHAVYGTCATAAGTAAKEISVSADQNFSLVPGCIIAVKFTNSNTASNVTLNVNSTGAKSIWYNTAAYTSTDKNITGNAGRVTTYMYDGTYWVWISNGVDNNTTYSNASLGQGYGTCATAEATAAKAVTLSNYALTVGGIVSVKFTYAVPASATLNVNTKGAKAIYYKGAAITAGIIKAGDVATFIYDGTQYHLIAIDGNYYTETEVDSLLDGLKTTLQTSINNKLDASAALKLGTTSSTAFRGDYGNTAYTHSQAAHAPSNAQKNSDITKSEIEAKLTGDISSHNHNGMYYTETEIDTKLAAKADSSHGTHVTWSTTTPKANGTAAVGSETKVARGDHVHPLQTTVSGNAGSATKLANSRNITIGSQTKAFNGTADISFDLPTIGAASITYVDGLIEGIMPEGVDVLVLATDDDIMGIFTETSSEE